ncbi:hypothetical protein [Metabacillus fastidiosus]|uniref:hypothetical protein n=1 Tax=Metabacillus fastidiosus TaxID=1458 RepID=UPI002E1C2F00|nr:hypothetical protein [Metabacillus fastidiosus]
MDRNSEKSNIGYTLFKPIGEQHEFPHIDLENQQVTGTVSYKGKTYITVMVDLKTDAIKVEVNIDDLDNLSMDKDSYIEMFKHQAKFLIENHISNPKKYYDELNI